MLVMDFPPELQLMICRIAGLHNSRHFANYMLVNKLWWSLLLPCYYADLTNLSPVLRYHHQNQAIQLETRQDRVKQMVQHLRRFELKALGPSVEDEIGIALDWVSGFQDRLPNSLTMYCTPSDYDWVDWDELPDIPELMADNVKTLWIACNCRRWPQQAEVLEHQHWVAYQHTFPNLIRFVFKTRYFKDRCCCRLANDAPIDKLVVEIFDTTDRPNNCIDMIVTIHENIPDSVTELTLKRVMIQRFAYNHDQNELTEVMMRLRTLSLHGDRFNSRGLAQFVSIAVNLETLKVRALEELSDEQVNELPSQKWLTAKLKRFICKRDGPKVDQTVVDRTLRKLQRQMRRLEVFAVLTMSNWALKNPRWRE